MEHVVLNIERSEELGKQQDDKLRLSTSPLGWFNSETLTACNTPIPSGENSPYDWGKNPPPPSSPAYLHGKAEDNPQPTPPLFVYGPNVKKSIEGVLVISVDNQGLYKLNALEGRKTIEIQADYSERGLQPVLRNAVCLSQSPDIPVMKITKEDFRALAEIIHTPLGTEYPEFFRKRLDAANAEKVFERGMTPELLFS